MLRAILGVIAGYIAMAILVFVSLMIAYLILGADGAFKPMPSFEISTTWIIASFILGFVAAVIGGLVCMLIAGRGSKAGVVLAAIVLVLGVAMALGTPSGPREGAPEARTDEIRSLEAMQWAEQPALTLWLNPLVGALGVLIGAKLCGGCAWKKDAPPAED